MKFRKLVLAGLVAASFTLASCGSNPVAPTTTPAGDTTTTTDDATTTTDDTTTSTDTRTYKEKVLDAFNALATGVASESFNAFTASYDEMIAKLKADGVITSTDEPVDMNATGGYVKDNSKGGELTEEGVKFADKAMAYGDVYVAYWDLATTELASTYVGFKNNGTIIINGGMYSVAATTDAYLVGPYVISFKAIAEKANSITRDWTTYPYGEGDAAYNEYKAGEMASVKTPLKARIDAVEALQASAKIAHLTDCTTADELAMALKTAGVLKVTDIAAKENVNDSKSYDALCRKWENGGWVEYDGQEKVKFATEAYKYGKVTLYYYDLANLDYSKPLDSIYASLKENKTSVLYSRTAYNAEYTAMEESFSVDAISGSFAISIEE